MNTLRRGIKYSKKLAVLKNTTMPALLIEIDFISNSEVENNLRDNKYLKDISDTISSTLLNFVNKSIDDEILYRVCIGAFNNKTNAINLKEQAIAKGFKDTYILSN
jgi:N-acetylmuramoyl-L-alanine amidase